MISRKFNCIMNSEAPVYRKLAFIDKLVSFKASSSYTLTIVSTTYKLHANVNEKFKWKIRKTCIKTRFSDCDWKLFSKFTFSKCNNLRWSKNMILNECCVQIYTSHVVSVMHRWRYPIINRREFVYLLSFQTSLVLKSKTNGMFFKVLGLQRTMGLRFTTGSIFTGLVYTMMGNIFIWSEVDL